MYHSYQNYLNTLATGSTPMSYAEFVKQVTADNTSAYNPVFFAPTNEQPRLLSPSNFIDIGMKLKNATISHFEHIDFLIPEIKQQLYFAKTISSVLQQGSLTLCEQDFEQSIKTQSISYKWWIYFSYRLALLLTPKEFRSPIFMALSGEKNKVHLFQEDKYLCTHGNFESLLLDESMSAEALRLNSLIEEFPTYTMIPTTANEVTISAFNKALQSNMLPLGISGTTINADGMLLHPDSFLRHDLLHFLSWTLGNHGPAVTLFIGYMHNKISHEADKRIQFQLEFLLFYMTHETAYYFLSMITLDEYLDKPQLAKFKSDLLMGAGGTSIYQLCEENSWYAPIISSWANNAEEIKIFIDEAIDIMERCIINYFATVHINSFAELPLVKRNYVIKSQLCAEEVAAHWSKSHPIAIEELKKPFFKKYTSNDVFFHFLIRKYPLLPNYDAGKNPTLVTHLFFRRAIEDFKKKPANLKSVLKLEQTEPNILEIKAPLR